MVTSKILKSLNKEQLMNKFKKLIQSKKRYFNKSNNRILKSEKTKQKMLRFKMNQIISSYLKLKILWKVLQ